MKTLRALFLSLLIATPTFAGIIEEPGITGIIEEPGITATLLSAADFLLMSVLFLAL